MVYLSVWVRRSNVLTGAEWISTRFGKGVGGNLAHLSVVTFALVSVIGFLAYAFQGIGKFSALFLPWDISPHVYALIFMGITTVYVVMGGMFSVVFTEVLQFAIMTVSSIAVGIIAMSKVSPELLNRFIPEGWRNIFFGWHLKLDWTGMMFKGILVSMAGPAPNYDMQRILATRNPKEAGMMSGFVNVVLIFPRYMLITGLTVLALAFFSPELKAMGAHIDFEMVLPYAIKNFLPVGLMGLLLAGLLSAFMSTFAATVNAAPAYIVNDLYKRFINPQASNKTYVRMSYIASLGVVAVGVLFGFFAKSINQVTLWIVAALWGGYAAPNVLKWYWWRFNAFGYFWGMILGILAAMAVPQVFPGLSALEGFPIILVVSTMGCIVASLITKPEGDDILKEFYSRVRPWGFWGPVYRKVIADNPDFKKNRHFKRDGFNIGIGLIWQITLVALPMYIVLKQSVPMVVALIILVLTSYLLKKNWYDKMDED
jgi:SSS family solute:Na+ symporter